MESKEEASKGLQLRASQGGARSPTRHTEGVAEVPLMLTPPKAANPEGPEHVPTGG